MPLTLAFITLPTLLATAFVVVCLFMMLVILIQKPKGGGLGSAFGGGGGGGSESAAFGAKTGDVLTWITVACFVLFLLLAMGLTWTIRAEAVPDAAAGQTVTTPADDDADADDADADAEDEETATPDSAAPVTGEPPADAEEVEQTLEELDTDTESADQ